MEIKKLKKVPNKVDYVYYIYIYNFDYFKKKCIRCYNMDSKE